MRVLAIHTCQAIMTEQAGPWLYAQKHLRPLDLQEFVSSIQLLFTNDLALSSESRHSVFKAATAFSETMEHQGTDRSVARVQPST